MVSLVTSAVRFSCHPEAREIVLTRRRLNESHELSNDVLRIADWVKLAEIGRHGAKAFSNMYAEKAIITLTHLGSSACN